MSRLSFAAVLAVLLVADTGLAMAATDEEFNLDLEELEKKDYEVGGFAEISWEHLTIRDDGAYTFLNSGKSPESSLDRFTGTLQLQGSYTKGITRVKVLAQAINQNDALESSGSIDLFEGNLSIAPSSWFSTTIGKKAYKWGKGYAWNPVGFINRMKDPNNPDDALEGYVTGEFEVIKSFAGDLQNIALNVVVLPVDGDVNDDFGEDDNINMAAKLYLLLFDTDIDFIAYTGNSRTNRYGLDFSRNVTSNFELHGELAYITDLERTVLQDTGNRMQDDEDVASFLAGIRHLTSWELTSIIEYYHNGSGYSDEQMEVFFNAVDAAVEHRNSSGLGGDLEELQRLGIQGYSRPYLGKNYLYAKFSQKEPFDILYFTPVLTTIINLDDGSSTVTPELNYTGFTNWEVQLRFALLSGSQNSEYGEKQNANKVELNIKYYF
ncbi:MAG: hypothetical protein F9K32_06015 [Desulfobulbaceae bacterium]|nr:MAG: hypothetical protein F9K32_06015 [Desulfobulbaceae bacterium]